MTPQILFSVGLRLLAVWLVCLGLIAALSMVTGPFATLIVGIILYFYARRRRKFDEPSAW